MNTTDPRSRIALHMNRTGTHLKVLLNVLSPVAVTDPPNATETDAVELLPDPTAAQVQAISPLAQIQMGNYCVPTFIVHGGQDDLIPWQQAARTYDALIAQGVPAQIRILDNAPHLFDIYKSSKNDPDVQNIISEAYEMLARSVS